ncbi:MAG: hypothetical protein HC915_21725 [Anaerolineae bacterium]|nr:hypothetical protein [Anaerolineae bacterium]
MERIPAQFAAFILLVVALLGLMYLADGVDFNTDVRTALETTLPGSYTDSASNVSLRHPEDWDVLPGVGGSFTLNPAFDAEVIATEPLVAGFAGFRASVEATRGQAEARLLQIAAAEGEAISADDLTTATYGAREALTYTLEVGETTTYQASSHWTTQPG